MTQNSLLYLFNLVSGLKARRMESRIIGANEAIESRNK